MNPRPIYRWKTFWFGVLVIAFLGWGWERSLRFHSFCLAGWIVLGQKSGEICFVVPLHKDRSPVEFVDVPFEQDSLWLAPAFTHESFKGDQWLCVAHWVLTILFLIPWAAFLAWRWRRLKRWKTKVSP